MESWPIVGQAQDVPSIHFELQHYGFFGYLRDERHIIRMLGFAFLLDRLDVVSGCHDSTSNHGDPFSKILRTEHQDSSARMALRAISAPSWQPLSSSFRSYSRRFSIVPMAWHTCSALINMVPG